MKPERWRQVEQLFQAALERAPDARAAFVNELCGDDDSLRREVEGLLAADVQVGSPIETPAYAVAGLPIGGDAQLLVGKRIGHYQVISLLGKGGMGEVYRARDGRLHRDVAIKVLPSDLSSDRDRLRRFEREAIAASSLNHPNILTIYEIGQDQSRRFMAAEFIDGVTLREWMKRGPRGPARGQRGGEQGSDESLVEALEIVTQVTSGLVAAHEAGIVHRDIKPENIMLRRDGYVKILDFGLAKLTERAAAAVDTEDSTIANVHTNPGAVMGTVRYMSPEQARGLELDARTDIFSVGVVLYEMIAGRPPFEGKTMSDVIAAILTAEPATLTQSSHAVPAELERLVNRALQKDRESRYQTSEQLLADLKELKRQLEASWRPQRHLQPSTSKRFIDELPAPSQQFVRRVKQNKRALGAGAIVIGLVALCLGYWSWSARKGTLPAAEIASLVALPAQVLGAQELSYLTDAIPGTLSTRLANVEGLETKVPPTSIEFGRINGDLGKIADLYGVRNCVVSSVTTVDADRSVLNVKLVECRNRRVLWSKEYEGRRGSYIEMARQAAQEILHQLKPDAAPLAAATSLAASSEAELAFRQGQYFWNRYNTRHEPADFDLALGALKRALDLDHQLADAAAEIALLYLFKFEAGAPAQEMIPEAETWANRTLAINPRCGKGWAALSMMENLRPSPDLRKMLEYSLKAASFVPQDSFVQNALCLATQVWSVELALATAMESHRLDPLFLHPTINAAEMLRYSGRHDESLALEEEALKMESDMPAGMFEKSATLLKLGRVIEAAGLVKRLEREAAQNRFPKSALMLLKYEIAAERSDAKAAAASLRGVVKMVNDPQTSWFDFQFAYLEVVPYLAKQGKIDLALQMLAAGPSGYVPPYDFLMLNPHLAPLRDDARSKPVMDRSRAQFDEMLKVVETARSRGEMVPYLEVPLTELLKKLGIKS